MASARFQSVPEGLCPHGPLFAGACALLRADALFGHVVAAFRCWEGDDRDASDPEVVELPWVRVTPRSAAGGWYESAGPGSRTLSQPLELLVETAVAGTDREDLFRLWGIIQRVFCPSDSAGAMAVAAMLRPAGAAGPPEVVQPATGLVIADVAGDDEGLLIRSRGLIRIPCVARA